MTDRNFTPFPVLKTARMTLRQLKNSDDQEIFALRSNDEVNQYLDRKPSQSMDDAKTFIRAINDNIARNDSLYWAVTLTGTDQLVGTICLFGFSEDNLHAEIGYELLPGFQGKGIMQEAASEVIEFGVKHIGLRSIEAYTHSENRASVRLLEKLNFKKERAGENFAIYKWMSDGQFA